ncbi:MAG: hypothetical protein LC113_07045 [Acidobacteria bacterium]|nr:hypothetical protein [Acidobacteriota bacterium]
MANERNILTVVVSALVGGVVAVVACFAYFTYYLKAAPASSGPPQTQSSIPTPTPMEEIPQQEIAASDIDSLKLVTTYKGYFDPGSKCSRSYNEYFGNDDAFASVSSPCEIEISLGRDGSVKRTITVRRWDKARKTKQVVETSVSAAQASADQFSALAEAIASNEAFKVWRDGMTITVSNCSITASHKGGKRTVLSNVDEKASAFLPMLDAFKKLERELHWQNAE